MDLGVSGDDEAKYWTCNFDCHLCHELVISWYGSYRNMWELPHSLSLSASYHLPETLRALTKGCISMDQWLPSLKFVISRSPWFWFSLFVLSPRDYPGPNSDKYGWRLGSGLSLSLTAILKFWRVLGGFDTASTRCPRPWQKFQLTLSWTQSFKLQASICNALNLANLIKVMRIHSGWNIL